MKLFELKLGMGVLTAIMVVATIGAEVAVQLAGKASIIDKIWGFEVALLGLMGVHRKNGGGK
jgi:steroid 5-alpha reductase family enzyme